MMLREVLSDREVKMALAADAALDDIDLATLRVCEPS